jgi:hypothetical protein
MTEQLFTGKRDTGQIERRDRDREGEITSRGKDREGEKTEAGIRPQAVPGKSRGAWLWTGQPPLVAGGFDTKDLQEAKVLRHTVDGPGQGLRFPSLSGCRCFSYKIIPGMIFQRKHRHPLSGFSRDTSLCRVADYAEQNEQNRMDRGL